MVMQFYKETEFKKVDLNGRVVETPKDWGVVRLGDVVEVYDSKRIPLSEQERANKKGPYPYCGATGIIDYIIDDYNKGGICFISRGWWIFWTV